MAEYIKRRDALKVLEQMETIEDGLDAMHNLPAANVVEVVRCRDCIGKDTLYTADGGILICGMSGLSPVEDRDFCSHGERRNNNANP